MGREIPRPGAAYPGGAESEQEHCRVRIDAPGIQIDRMLELERLPDLLRELLSVPAPTAPRMAPAPSAETDQSRMPPRAPQFQPEPAVAAEAQPEPMEEAAEAEDTAPLDGDGHPHGAPADEPEEGATQTVSDAWPRPARRAVRPGAPPRPRRLLAESTGGSGVRTYLRAKRPPTNPERIAVVGRYLELAEGVAAFSRSDLREGLADAGIPEPRNFARDLQTALARGYLVALSDGSRLQVAGPIRDLIDRDGPVWLPRGGKREAVFDTDFDAEEEA
ncbi:MAG: hypothetical protein QNJ92_09340 [Alphaproteobacteria bacterium]|nr:hypothetical protein [Alphaproteobacteria bacterium]